MLIPIMFAAGLALFAFFLIYCGLDDEDWGHDEYGRYHEVDGEPYMIEPYPFWDRGLRGLWMHLVFRIEIIKWWLHHGNSHKTTRYCPKCLWLLKPTPRDDATCTCLNPIYDDDDGGVV